MLNHATKKPTNPRDVFLHLLEIITLFWSVIATITLCWAYIDHYFHQEVNLGSLRFAISSLLIVYPVYIWVIWHLNQIYQVDKEASSANIRKWLTYLTIFSVSLVIIIDLITAIDVFLQGDITLGFVLKALTILAISSMVFSYYLGTLKGKLLSKNLKYYAFLLSFSLLILIGFAFCLIGSPNHIRLVKLDEQRIVNLQSIQFQLVNYWKKKSHLPEHLDELNNSILGYNVPVDPSTLQSYEYQITNPATLAFTLCAVFNTNYTSFNNPEWNHGTGHVCFQRKIDKELNK